MLEISEFGKVMDKSNDLQRKLQELLHATDQFFTDDFKPPGNTSYSAAIIDDSSTPPPPHTFDAHGVQFFENSEGVLGTIEEEGDDRQESETPRKLHQNDMEPFSDYVTYSSAPSSRPMAENESRNMLVRDQKLGSQARMEDPLQGEFPREVLDQDTTTRAAFCMSLLTQKHLQDFLTSHLSAITDFESKVRRRLSRFQVSINVVQNRLAMYKASQKFSSTRAVASKNAHAEASRPQQTLPYSEYEKLEFVNRELTRKLGSSLKYKIECEELRQAIDGCWTKIAELEGENRHLRAENSRLSSEMLRPIQWAPDQQLVAANHAEVYQANHENSVRQSADEIFQLRAEMAEGRRELYKVTAMLEMFKEENMALQEKLENAESKVKVLVERGINM